MKIQTKAIIKQINVGGKSVLREGDKAIDLEFSAIDTGGGFKDPILDFSFDAGDLEMPDSVMDNGEISVTLLDPRNKENTAAFSYEPTADFSGGQINGRLKEDQLSRELIGFVVQLLR